MADVHRPHIPVAVFMGIIGAIAPLVIRGPPRHLRFCAILSAATHPPATSACHPIPHIWPAPEQHPRPIIRFAAYFSFPIILVDLYAALPDIGPKSHSDRYNLRVRRPGHYHYHARVRYNARAMGLPARRTFFGNVLAHIPDADHGTSPPRPPQPDYSWARSRTFLPPPRRCPLPPAQQNHPPAAVPRIRRAPIRACSMGQ